MSFLELIKWIGANPLMGILSIFISFISVGLAVIFYSKSKKVKLPCYSIVNFNVIRNLVSKIESLEMLYSGQPIENLSVGKIAFWNEGRETITNQDIASVDPLCVHIKEGNKILNAKILYVKEPANKFSIVSINPSSFSVNFEYIDINEGVVIQIIHTAKSEKDIEVGGKIKWGSHEKRLQLKTL